MCYNPGIVSHLYLCTLEIVPLKVGAVYDELPSHLTLMSRFASALSPQEMTAGIRPVFTESDPVAMTFGPIERLGPKQVAAHMIDSQAELALHHRLHAALSSLKVTYQYPQFNGAGHRAHVSVREGVPFVDRQQYSSLAAYLIEVVDKKRVVRVKFELAGSGRVLASIYPQDVDPSVKAMDYSTFKTRPAGRAIVFSDDKVALIKVREHNYYMLPGGGLDGEDVRAGIAREILEELGAEIELEKEVGIIETFIDRWKNRQVDHCFTAQLIHANSQKALTTFEVEEGHELVWAANIDEAIGLVEAANPGQTDGKLVRARDLKFLQICKSAIMGQ